MPEIAQGEGLPTAWWLAWFVIAFLAYGVFAVWFWQAGRDGDRTSAPPRKAEDESG